MYDFNHFKYIEACFITQHMVCPENVAYTLEKNVYFAVPGWSALGLVGK